MFFESRSNRFITYFQEEIFSFLREKLLKAQEKMKQQARLKQTDIEFKEGDWVYLQLQPFRQRQFSLDRIINYQHDFCPLKISKKINPITYHWNYPKFKTPPSFSYFII